MMNMTKLLADSSAATIAAFTLSQTRKDLLTQAAQIDVALKRMSLDLAEKAEPQKMSAVNGVLSELFLGSPVKLALSHEAGAVVGIADYSRRPRAHLVEYLAGDGRQTDGWFDRESLVAL